MPNSLGDILFEQLACPTCRPGGANAQMHHQVSRTPAMDIIDPDVLQNLRDLHAALVHYRVEHGKARRERQTREANMRAVDFARDAQLPRD
jgi:hypothetical protein